MKSVVFLTLLAAVAAIPADDVYDPRYDSFNVDELVENTRLLKAYSHCFLGDGNCTPDGKNFKKYMPDAVQTNCAKCSAKQKVMIAKVIKAMMAKLPDEWNKLVKVYDPEEKRSEDLNAYLKQYAP
ncbi:hypothetical protein O0L34_g7654 [Tuta absoluta]|nr:hypothetical protein O0L34_g7654 [Tuta absoluta]